MTRQKHLYQFPDNFPGLPESGMELVGTCSNPFGTVSVKESKEHPGYLDMTISNCETQIIASTRRPVKRSTFALEYLQTSIDEEFSNSPEFKWKIEKIIQEQKAPRECMVYFVYAPLAYKVKIGSSNSPRSRLDALQTGSPERLRLIGTMHGGVKKERELHKRFAECRSHGEWFDMSPEINRFIEENCDDYALVF